MYQNEQSYIVNEGDLIVFLPSVVHSVHAVSDAPLQYYVLKFFHISTAGSTLHPVRITDS